MRPGRCCPGFRFCLKHVGRIGQFAALPKAAVAPSFRLVRHPRFVGGWPKDAVVAQLVRAPVCGTGGRWFEPTQLYQEYQILTKNGGLCSYQIATTRVLVQRTSRSRRDFEPKARRPDALWSGLEVPAVGLLKRNNNGLAPTSSSICRSIEFNLPEE